jgi:hypothetical protein
MPEKGSTCITNSFKDIENVQGPDATNLAGQWNDRDGLFEQLTRGPSKARWTSRGSISGRTGAAVQTSRAAFRVEAF